jgi:DNA-binding winged helix-turn-helix (wHTH) protein
MLYQFGQWELDEELFELRLRGAPVSAAPKVFDTLLILFRNRHRVVTKSELLALVWKGSVVTDDALSFAVRKARRILSEAPEGGTIETIRGRGYRFVCALAPIDRTASSPVARAAAVHTPRKPHQAPLRGRSA